MNPVDALKVIVALDLERDEKGRGKRVVNSILMPKTFGDQAPEAAYRPSSRKSRLMIVVAIIAAYISVLEREKPWKD